MTSKKTNKHTSIQNKPGEIIPPEYRSPGLGEWKFSRNGYGRFLETAISHFKSAATRMAENGLEVEYSIFNERWQELQKKLDEHNLEQEKLRKK